MLIVKGILTITLFPLISLHFPSLSLQFQNQNKHSPTLERERGKVGGEIKSLQEKCHDIDKIQASVSAKARLRFEPVTSRDKTKESIFLCFVGGVGSGKNQGRHKMESGNNGLVLFESGDKRKEGCDYECDFNRKNVEADDGGNLCTNSVVYEWKRDGNVRPPQDDCCPICFGDFIIPCRTNCRHWFCANCILEFWNYRQDLQKCICPICSGFITNLTPEASSSLNTNHHEKEVAEILKNVRNYNLLFQGGFYGFIGKVLASPIIMKKMICSLMDPDRFGKNFLALRVIAMAVSAIYNIIYFDFTLSGYLETRSTVDIVTVAIVIGLCLMGILRKVILKHRVRRLAASLAD